MVAPSWRVKRAVLAAGGRALVLRTSWVYSHDGQCFFNTMRQMLAERDELHVVEDQLGAPTWAPTIATTTRQLVERLREQGDVGGLYHLTNAGQTSWYGLRCRHRRAPGATRRAACRSSTRQQPNTTNAGHATALFLPGLRKIEAVLPAALPHWQADFDRCWALFERDRQLN